MEGHSHASLPKKNLGDIVATGDCQAFKNNQYRDYTHSSDIFRVREYSTITSSIIIDDIHSSSYCSANKIERLPTRLRPKVELRRHPLHGGSSAPNGTMTSLEHPDSFIASLFEMVHGSDVTATFQRFSPGTPPSCAEEVTTLMQAQNNRLLLLAGMIGAVSSRPKQLSWTQNLRAAVLQGANLRKSGNLTVPTSAGADLRAATCAEPAGPGAPEPGPLRTRRQRWPEGFELIATRVPSPGANLSGKYLCTADLRGMDLRGCSMLGVHFLSGCRSARRPFSKHLLCGRRPAGARCRSLMARLPLPGHRARRLRLPPGLTCAEPIWPGSQQSRGGVSQKDAGIEEWAPSCCTAPTRDWICWESPGAIAASREQPSQLRWTGADPPIKQADQTA